jgi:predicted nucleotidyltransferase component of viral defense system
LKETIYFKQVKLLLRILPYIEAENVFALKGGKAINFFVRELPRLSVDIDLAYISVSNRDDALADISRALKNISSKAKRIFSGCQISLIRLHGSDFLQKIIIRSNVVTVKIEPNLIMRRTINDPVVMELSQNAQNAFEMSVGFKTLSFSELYASKICATFDRQHPRDLFDMHLLLKNEGIDKKMHKAFII